MATLAILPAGRGSADPVDPRIKYDEILPDAYYDALAKCETNSNWNHSTKSYTGGLGIYRGTWRWFSNTKYAENKSPKYQVKIADKIAFLGHWEDGIYHEAVGPWGWGCVKRHKWINKYICKSKIWIVKQYKWRC